MYQNPRNFVDALGGYRLVAPRLGLATTTLHTHITSGKLPAKLYKACCALSAECDVAPPPLCLFSFTELAPSRAKLDLSGEDAA